MAAPATVTAAVTPLPEDEKSLPQELSLPIILADRVIKAAQEAESSKSECADMARQVDWLSQMLRSCVRLAASTQSLYERPVRRIVADVTKNLDRALTLVRKCKHTGVLRHVFSITTSADFRKVSSLLDSSIGDMRWLLTIFDSDETNLSLPPIASNDPILAWVWSSISTVQMGQINDRIDAANQLASLALDNNRNKKMIVEEAGIPPLLKLLKETSSPDAQIAAAKALSNVGTEPESVRLMVDVLGVPIIVGVLGESSTRVQTAVANLVARMADVDPLAREEFVRENVTRPLISLLCTDMVLELPKAGATKTSIHSIVQMNKEMTDKSYHHLVSSNSDGSSRGGGHYKKERDLEAPELRVAVQVACAEALWMLSKGSLMCCRKITETKGLLGLAKIIETQKGELQFNCLMTVMEITGVAELNAELRRAAFKTNSPAAKAVLDQLLRVIQEESDSQLQIPAIRSIGCLARTFPAKERRMIGPLVGLLGHRNVSVATEAAIALGKFVSPENFNCSEHSKAIIEFDGVPPLMKLLISDQCRSHVLVLLCYLALSAGNSKALEQARALHAIEGAARSVGLQHPQLKDLITKAVNHLTLYQAAAHPHRQSFAP